MNFGKLPFQLNNLLFCFCSFDLSWPVLEKDNFIEHLYIVSSCLINWCYINLFVFYLNDE